MTLPLQVVLLSLMTIITLLLLPHSTHGFDIRQPYSGYQRGCAVAPHLSSNEYNIQRRGRRRRSTLLFEQHLSRQANNDGPSFRVGIVGAGSISFGTASLTSSLGHIPMIWSPSGDGTKDLIDATCCCAARSEKKSLADDAIIISEIQSTGALYHTFNVRVATSPQVLIRRSDVLVFALPVNGHKSVMEELAPHIIELIMEQKRYHQEGMQSKSNGNMIQLQHIQPLPIMHIIISSHSSLGAVYFMKVLREEKRRYLQKMNDQSQTMIDSTSWNYDDDDDIDIRITCWGSTSVTARKTSGTSVNVLTVREIVDFCTVPSCFPENDQEVEKDSMETEMISSMDKREILENGYTVCTTLFGKRFKRRKGGLLAISLSNLNPQNHLGIVLGNMSRMDPPPPPPPPYYEKGEESATKSKMDATTIEPWYQGKNITPNIGRLMEALDRERIAIANALDIEVRTIYEHFSWSFHVPMETPVTEEDSNHECDEPLSSSSKKMRPLTVSEMNQQMHYYLNNDVLGPSTANSRYVIEDVPYGLALTVILGKLVNRPTTLHEAGIRILSAMYGVDFMMENDLLQGLKLLNTNNDGNDNIPSLDEWRKMAYNGYFS